MDIRHPWVGTGRDELTADEANRMRTHLLLLERVTSCLLDHYLNCYGGNEDRLAKEAIELVPNWKALVEEWPAPRIEAVG